jgi:hypothetical protein
MNKISALSKIALALTASLMMNQQGIAESNQESSAFVKLLTDAESPFFDDAFARASKDGDLSLFAPSSPACPTFYQWSKDQQMDVDDLKNGLVKSIKKGMSEFPKDTIEKCSAVSPVILNGIIKDHQLNDGPQVTMIVVSAFKDTQESDVKVFAATAQTDIPFGGRSTIIYGSQLDKICDMKKVSDTQHNANCAVLGDVVFTQTRIDGFLVGQAEGSNGSRMVFTTLPKRKAMKFFEDNM